MANILITGGSGLVGKKLTGILLEKGHTVRHLSRTKKSKPEIEIFKWDYKNGFIEEGALKNIDYIFHLAGASVAGRKWTESYKKEIRDSRVHTTQLIYNKIKEVNHNLKGFITASAIGYYGLVTKETIMTETLEPAPDFFGKVCAEWEKSADHFSEFGFVTKLRISVVLSSTGGALEKLMLPAKLGLSAAVGSGKQWMPWIHIDDLVNMFIFAMENQLDGAFNAAAEEHVTNNEFTSQLAKAVHRPFFLPNIPKFGLSLVMGEMSDILLEGSRVDNSKIKATNFEFKYNKLKDALKNLV
jgi:hypothetical protein